MFVLWYNHIEIVFYVDRTEKGNKWTLLDLRSGGWVKINILLMYSTSLLWEALHPLLLPREATIRTLSTQLQGGLMMRVRTTQDHSLSDIVNWFRYSHFWDFPFYIFWLDVGGHLNFWDEPLVIRMKLTIGKSRWKRKRTGKGKEKEEKAARLIWALMTLFEFLDTALPETASTPPDSPVI